MDKSATLATNNDQYLFQPICCYDIGDRRRVPNEYVDVSPTLLGQMGTGGNNVPIVMNAVGVDCYNQGINAKFDIGIDEDGIAFTHVAKGPGAVAYCIQGNVIDRADTANCNGSGIKEDCAFALNTVDRPAVAYVDTSHADDVVVYNGANITSPINKASPQLGDPCHTLDTDYRNYLVKTQPYYIVRRLTPMECERLQGYPDGWTDIGEYTDSNGKKKKSADASRYKALGNSIALPPWKWVLKRLCSHYERDATMASLFDGIGGFPLIWEQLNGIGSCIWASEIEEFPMAVTAKRICER